MARSSRGGVVAVLDDGDRLLNLAGIAIVGFILIGVGTIVIAGLNAGNTAGTPEAEWQLVRVNDTHVQIGHVGGDNVSSRELAVTVGGENASVDWRGVVGQGDATIFRAEPMSTVRLYWTAPKGDRILLQTWPNAGASRTGEGRLVGRS